MMRIYAKPLVKMIVRDKPNKILKTQYIFHKWQEEENFNLPFFVYKK